MLNRRIFLLSSAAFGAAGLTGCTTATTTSAGKGSRDEQLDGLLTRWFEEDLRDNPTFATNLGLDTGELAHLRGRLGSESLAEAREERSEARMRHQMLESFGRRGMSEAGALNYDIALFRRSVDAEGAQFEYGQIGGRPAPYVLSQLGGAYYSVPDFLDSQHPIATKSDADYYLTRLEDFARNLNQETERLEHDVRMGVIPPDFVIDKTVSNLEQLRRTPAGETTLVRSIDRRAKEKGLGDYRGAASQIVSGPVHQALDRQIAALKRIRPAAGHDAGVWRLPNGEDYYRYALRYNTTTDYTPDQIHQIGLDQVRDLHARLDTLLRAEGYTKGSVGDRLNATNKEARFLFPNTDKGRADLLASLNKQVAQITPLLPRVFRTLPKAAVDIRRVPPAIEAGAPGGYYQGASLDGARPGAYYINLKDTHKWPSLGLPTLTWHEAVPGHHFQITVSREAGELPLYRRTQGFAAYNEGWALYAERVADELGVYSDDPFGRIGFLQSYLFRAVRLVVDTGIHHKRWSREQAIKWMVDNAAEPEGSATREIERYSVWPGQACAYKLGETVISRLRGEMEAKPGFDIKAFHDAVLLGGSMPLTVLERRVRSEMA
ncbi:MAG TPA: DUF885 family protein [Allosphingosinicella sp.]|nr:DUF885 family protein [Allosphingosinicella sp.]